MSVSDRKWTTGGLLTVITLFGAWLRTEGLGKNSLWLDEILNVRIIRALDEIPAYGWLIGFERENGPVYYALHALSLSLAGPVELAMRLPAVVAGVIAIVAIFFVSRRYTGSSRTGLVAALLLSVSPFHVYYSREGRPYALLVLLTLLALHSMLGERGPRPIRVLIVLVIAAGTAATSIPLLATVALLAAIAGLSSGEHRQRWLVTSGLAVLSVAIAAGLYGRFRQPEPAAGFEGSLSSLGSVILNGFTLTSEQSGHLQPLALIAVAMALIGFISIKDRFRGSLLVGAWAFPIAISIGGLALTDHWFSLRYVIHALAPFLILVAAGIAGVPLAIARMARRRMPLLVAPVAPTLTVILVAPFFFAALEPARHEPRLRADWRRVATVLDRYAEDEELVVASSAWSEVSLRFYLEELGRSLDVRNVRGSVGISRYLVERRDRSWIVTGGFEPEIPVRRWACDKYLISRDEEEDVRLYYAPNLMDFVANRASGEEIERFARMFLETRGGRIEMERWENDYLGGGWYGAERAGGETFRWADREATVRLPVLAGQMVLRMSLSPYPEEQELTVLESGEEIARLDLPTGRAEYEIELGESHRSRIAEVTFRFARAVSPASLGRSVDTRPLSAAFDWIELSGARRAGRPAPLLFHVDGYLDEDAMSGGAEVASDPRTERACEAEIDLSDEARRLLLLGLGFEGEMARLVKTRGDVPVVEALPAPECLSDPEFVRWLFLTLLERPPDRVGRTFYEGSLAAGWPRKRIACMMMESEEFRQTWERAARESLSVPLDGIRDGDRADRQ